MKPDSVLSFWWCFHFSSGEWKVSLRKYSELKISRGGEVGFEEIFLSAGRSFSFFKNVPSRFAADCSTKIIIIIMKIIGTTASVWRWSPIQVLTPPDRACLSPVAVLMLKSFCQKKHHPPLPPIFYSQCFPFTLASQWNTATIVFLVNIYFFVSVITHTRTPAWGRTADISITSNKYV